ncbi:HTH_Tnp_Tc3_2 domain-containing protein [Trichonephila clavipes]|nr:HTH_Tnp_Tc3_2 domain-containing protein [Trichonephila clavipes]
MAKRDGSRHEKKPPKTGGVDSSSTSVLAPPLNRLIYPQFLTRCGSQNVECTVAEGQDVPGTQMIARIVQSEEWPRTNNVASIDSIPPSRHSAMRNHKERLTEVGLRSRRPLRRLPLTPHYRQCRLDFADLAWSVTDWRRVIFSYESRFSLSADDHRTCLEAHRPAIRSVIYCPAISQGVTVWGAISWDTRSSLVVLQGTLTARRYVDDILTPIVLPMLSSRPGAIYQQDNARPHTARLSPMS